MTEADRWNALANAAEDVTTRWALTKFGAPLGDCHMSHALDALAAALDAWPEGPPDFPGTGKDEG